MKLAYIVNKINGTSGIQRMVAFQINYFIKNYYYKVDLILLDQNKNEEKSFYEVDSAVNFHFLKSSSSIVKDYYNKILAINKALKTINPDIVMVCESDIFSLYLPLFTKGKYKMIYQRHDLKELNLITGGKSLKTKVKNQIKKLFLSGAGKHYDKFVLLSKAHRVDWKGLKNIHIISNPIIIDSKGNKANLDSKIVLAVGRHDPIKGFDMLLKSWQNVVEQHPDWILKMVGKQTHDTDLKILAKKLNISEYVDFKEYVRDMSPIYLESSIFVCSSRVEAFPLVVIEAMSFGIPVVSFDCDYGPREIIKNSVDGILVSPNDIDFLAESICSLIENENIRKEMGERASENIKRYSVDKIMNQWKLLFEEVTSDA